MLPALLPHCVRSCYSLAMKKLLVPILVCGSLAAPAFAFNHPKVEHPKAIHPKSEHSKAVHPQSIHPKAYHPKAEHPKAVHPKNTHVKPQHRRHF